MSWGGMRMSAVLLAGLTMALAAGGAWADVAALPATTRPDPATAPAAAAATAATTPTDKAVVIPLHGMIDDYNRDGLMRRFAEARELGAGTVILDVNTYGGLVTAGLDISRFLKQQDDLRVIAFVGEKAISAGAMVALAADEIVMAPAAKIGDSAPIAVGPGGGGAPMGEAERAKAESPILEDFYESAVKNGYDPLLAEAMVAVGRTVHWVENRESGARRFVEAAEYEKLATGDDAAWKAVDGVRNPIDRADTLLTVHTDLARTLGLARGVASSPEALAAERGLAVVANLAPSAGERLVGWLASPLVRLFMIVVFMGSLYVALHTPGHGGAEALAVAALGSLVGIPLLTGYAQWWEVLAILIGLALLAIEVFVLPGFGVAGITGLALFLGGLTMTFVGTEPVEIPGWLPTLDATWDAFRRGLFIVAGGMAGSLFLWFWLSRYLPKLPYFNRIILTATAGGDAPGVAEGVAAAEGPIVGDRAHAVSDLRPGGSARLTRDGRIVSVVSDGGFVEAGDEVVVREVGGNRVVVRPIPAGH